MYEKIQSGLRNLSDDFSRECDDLTAKIEQIMRTELLTLEKLKDISSVALHP
jgi:hypothetical protein